ncbi:hypothetical protein Tco_1092018 [Tanacetum coccineum]|uniref:Uncharacterized protein n=1 Tax=Tanacetum coccineum TaxID=301880 RepID=A0ABQ5I8P0_9ASTR
MFALQDKIPPPPPPPSSSQTPTQQTPHTVSTIKLSILKKGEYDIWAMKMEHYLAHIDYPIWEVIQNGNGPIFKGFSVYPTTEGLQKAMTGSKSSWCQLEIHRAERLLCSNPSGQNSQYEQTSSYSLLANQSSCPQLDHEDLEQIDEYDLEEMDLKSAKVAMILPPLTGQKEDSKALVTIDGEGVDWTNHSEDEDYALMTCNSSDSDTKREQLSDASIEIKAYSQGLKKVEAQLVAHQQGQLWFVIVDGMHAVPPPMTGNYMPSGPEIEVDYSQFTYGPNRLTSLSDAPIKEAYDQIVGKMNYVNRVRPVNVFYKTHSPSSRPFKKTTVLRTDFSQQKVNTAKENAVSTVGGKK